MAPEGGDHTTVADAIADIVAAADNTAATPYVIDVGPGTYDGRFSVPSHTTVRGAGRHATVITASVDDSLNVDADSSVIDISDAANVTVADMTIDPVIPRTGTALNIVASSGVIVERVNLVADTGVRPFAVFVHDGQPAVGSEPNLVLDDTRIVSGSNTEAVGVHADDGHLHIAGSSITTTGHLPVGVRMQGGVLRIDSTVITVAGSNSGSSTLDIGSDVDVAIRSSELVTTHRWLIVRSGDAAEKAPVVVGTIINGTTVLASSAIPPRCAGSIRGDGTPVDNDCE